jgi:hypothetical protein
MIMVAIMAALLITSHIVTTSVFNMTSAINGGGTSSDGIGTATTSNASEAFAAAGPSAIGMLSSKTAANDGEAPETFYSSRNAEAGSVDMARRAGSHAAARATAPIRRAASAKVTGSLGLIP